MAFAPGQSGNPTGRKPGSRNKRTEEIFTRLENRGDLDPAELLSAIVTNKDELKELRIQAAGLLLPYKYSKMGATPAPPPLLFIENPVSLLRPTSIQQATDNISYLSELKANGQIDRDWGDSLIADNRVILEALLDQAKLMGHSPDVPQVIHIRGGLPELPGTKITMPQHNGHELEAVPNESLPALEQTNNSVRYDAAGRPENPGDASPVRDVSPNNEHLT